MATLPPVWESRGSNLGWIIPETIEGKPNCTLMTTIPDAQFHEVNDRTGWTGVSAL